MQSLVELGKKPDVIAFLAAQAEAEKVRAMFASEDARVEAIYEEGELYLDRIHQDVHDLLWEYAKRPDSTKQGIVEFGEACESAVWAALDGLPP